MKRKNPTTYTPPEVDVYVIECADIITTSNDPYDDPNTQDW